MGKLRPRNQVTRSSDWNTDIYNYEAIDGLILIKVQETESRKDSEVHEGTGSTENAGYAG